MEILRLWPWAAIVALLLGLITFAVAFVRLQDKVVSVHAELIAEMRDLKVHLQDLQRDSVPYLVYEGAQKNMMEIARVTLADIIARVERIERMLNGYLSAQIAKEKRQHDV